MDWTDLLNPTQVSRLNIYAVDIYDYMRYCVGTYDNLVR